MKAIRLLSNFPVTLKLGVCAGLIGLVLALANGGHSRASQSNCPTNLPPAVITSSQVPPDVSTPLIFALGFLATFLFGGLTGIIIASPPMDFHVTDSYFIVAHFHYTVFGTVVFAMFSGFYFWWPKLTGRMLDEMWGKVHFVLLFVGFHTTFLIQHWLGVDGMPRRYADYLPEDGFTLANRISSVGSMLIGLSTLAFLYNVWLTWRTAPLVIDDDPWGYGAGLEWCTSCPPPRHNFNSIPRIRSERPAFDLHHPEAAPAGLTRSVRPKPPTPPTESTHP